MKTRVMKYLKGTTLMVAGGVSAMILNVNIAYATISTRLSPIFAFAQSELLIIGRNLCIIALILCGMKYAMASDAQSAKSAKDWAWKIGIGLIIMLLASEIVPLFADQIAGGGTGTV